MNTSGRRRTFVVAKFYPGGGDMKVTTINIRSVNLHAPEPFRLDTDGGVRYRNVSSTTTTTGDTTITDPVSIRFFKTPAPDPFSYEALIVVVAHPMA